MTRCEVCWWELWRKNETVKFLPACSECLRYRWSRRLSRRDGRVINASEPTSAAIQLRPFCDAADPNMNRRDALATRAVRILLGFPDLGFPTAPHLCAPGNQL